MTVDDRPLTFGLIGCGAISTQHVEAITALPGARLGAVASASMERARAAGERWGVPWTTDVDELLARDDLDAISITTPSGLHAGQALAALGAGRHVLVEKPLALSVADADAVIAGGRSAGLTVGTISQRRFEPVIRAARATVVQGALGRVTMIIAEGLYHRPQSYYDSAPWRGTIALDGGVLMNQAIHMVDLVRWFGGPVDSVAAHVATLGHAMEAEDAASVSLRFASGAVGEIVATTTVTPEFPAELRVYGDAGHVRIVGEAVAEWDVPGVAAPSAGTDTPGDGADAPSASTATWGTTAVGYARQYTDYVAAVRERRPPFVSGEDGRNAVELVTAAYESSRTSRAVELAGAAR
jgi:UDP-N-acetyl-2-amino-2-deoxyglucuronate dehydrogenase